MAKTHIQVTSVLNSIIEDVVKTKNLNSAKSIITLFINNSNINREDTILIIDIANKPVNHKMLIIKMYNLILKYEGLGVIL